VPDDSWLVDSVSHEVLVGRTWRWAGALELQSDGGFRI